MGFEPFEDYQHLVLEGRGRRLSNTAPEQSLLLLKATGQVPHGGGVRLDSNSDQYRVIIEWIRQGALYEWSKRDETPLDRDPTRRSNPRAGC